MNLSQKDFKKVLKAANLAGRINELERIEPFVPSNVILTRKGKLKKELKELVSGKEEKEEQVLSIKIEVPEVEEKRRDKSLSLNLRDLFKTRAHDDDDEVVKVVKSVVSDEDFCTIGRIIKEL